MPYLLIVHRHTPLIEYDGELEELKDNPRGAVTAWDTTLSQF